MSLTNKCPICGTATVIKDFEQIVRGGDNTALIKVKAAICHKCGEVVFDARSVRFFEEVSAKLARGDIASFKAVGKSFRVTASPI